jgi:molybdopterin/thiamine biosynthesis adenylyltransferase
VIRDAATSLGLRLLDPEVDSRAIDELRDGGATRVVDAFDVSVDELFRLDHPWAPEGSPEFNLMLSDYRQSVADGRIRDVYVHFPWRSTMVRLVEESSFTRLRTARNMFLVTPEEQARFRSGRVAVAGMSVGSSAVTSLVLTGGPKELAIADFDTLGPTNLNRLPASVCDLGSRKVEIAARKLLEMDPFANISVYADGLNRDDQDEFLGGDNPVDLFVEEIDSIDVKIASRFAAREKRIPVLMATDNGDNAMLDVERFDEDGAYPLFHGLVAEDVLAGFGHAASMAERVRLAAAIVGSNVTPRTQQSLMAVGSRIPAWPQMGTAATVAGAVVAYAARLILTGQGMPSGRYHVPIDAPLDPTYYSTSALDARQAGTADFELGLELIYGGQR